VSEWARRTLGIFAGSDRLVVDVEVRAAGTDEVIGLAHAAFDSRMSLLEVNEDVMVIGMAETLVGFLVGEKPPP
jgi:hypothetical protein